MNRTLVSTVAAAVFCTLPSFCQEKVPIYRVTVVQRNVDSVNYQYHAGPTKVDLRGTVVLPDAKGDATVESHQGRTQIDAHFEGLTAPQRFGREYLSYVLWAVTPDGGPHNLGEIVPNSSDKGHLPVTSDLQAFALLVTAEPYAAVRHPSDVVVMENQIRQDTVGEIHPVRVKVELMPRGMYQWNVPESESAGAANAPKVSMSRYQAILQVYEAQNALGIAKAAGAEQYAAETYQRAQREFDNAQRMQASKGDDDRIVQYARAAAEMAEDARTIADKRRQDEQLASARKDTADAQQAQMQAEAQLRAERARADGAQAEAQAERARRESAELQAQMIKQQAQQQPAVVVVERHSPPTVVVETRRDTSQDARAARARLLQSMSSTLLTRDTPRGLEVTLSDGDFAGSQLRPNASQAVSQIAAMLAAHPDLRVSVEGNTDSTSTSEFAAQRATAVAAALTRAGMPARQVSTQNLGNSHLIGSNATERGRMENRRVEIVIAGDSIGSVPSWDRTYPLVKQ